VLPNEPTRKIIHIDMDAFYASVEQRDHPAYRGKPIAVGGSPDKRGAVAAASYEARQFGVYSALPSRVAVQRCPHLIFVQPRFEVYRTVSQHIRNIFQRYTDLVEPLALDEAYLDVTNYLHPYPSATAIAQAIRQTIWNETHLTASAGVSINKFLAKLASGANKPNGICVIPPDQAEAFVAALPIEKFHGIGRVTAKKMNAIGIYTGADLRLWGEDQLIEQFGKAGHVYYTMARATDLRPVNPNRIRKSISAETSFDPDLINLYEIYVALEAIALEVEQRLTKYRKVGHTVVLKVKYADYQQITRSRTQDTAIHAATVIEAVARTMLAGTEAGQKPVRLLGIGISKLIDSNSSAPTHYHQLSLPL
jgi:DNA polymerase-4